MKLHEHMLASWNSRLIHCPIALIFIFIFKTASVIIVMKGPPSIVWHMHNQNLDICMHLPLNFYWSSI
ncbi:conserved hypothetical protein [Ricinus communis]|uniref:Uncharacterized protein n=1 Tax=Ricinus communis TaxID=3988 RepID=B9RCD9_RICCO|nr:conserved hypothetical protein [Ricinus communis]